MRFLFVCSGVSSINLMFVTICDQIFCLQFLPRISIIIAHAYNCSVT